MWTMTSPASTSTQSACGMPSTRRSRLPSRLQLLDQLVGDGADVTVRAAGGDHHAVGDGGLSVEIDGDDVLGLGIFELGEDDGEDQRALLVLRFGAALGLAVRAWTRRSS